MVSCVIIGAIFTKKMSFEFSFESINENLKFSKILEFHSKFLVKKSNNELQLVRIFKYFRVVRRVDLPVILVTLFRSEQARI